MRGKRSKQYRKLMEQYCMTFGFREPYQVLVDAEIVRDSCRFKMDLAPALQRTVHAPVKPMITQCEIRKLYAQKAEPGGYEAIELAKTFERRRCGHHPEQYPEPLDAKECLLSVVDPKDTSQNKHRYVVATQDQIVRRLLRSVQGVPLIYIKRSVMILEPMADDSVQVRAKEERSKFRQGLKQTVGKRKRDAPEEGAVNGGTDSAETGEKPAKRKTRGPKGPNPLSVPKKTKKKPEQPSAKPEAKPPARETTPAADAEPTKAKRRRRRKAPRSADAAVTEAEVAPTALASDG